MTLWTKELSEVVNKINTRKQNFVGVFCDFEREGDCVKRICCCCC